MGIRHTATASFLFIIVCFSAFSGNKLRGLPDDSIRFENGLISMELKNERLDAAVLNTVGMYDTSSGQPVHSDEPILNWLIHPQVGDLVTIKLSGVTKQEAVRQILLRSTIGRFSTGTKSKKFPDGNIMVLVPYEKTLNPDFMNQFVDINNKTYSDKRVFLDLYWVQREDIFRLLSEVMKKKITLHERCKGGIVIRCDNLPADMLLDLICALLEFKIDTDLETGNIHISPKNPR